MQNKEPLEFEQKTNSGNARAVALGSRTLVALSMREWGIPDVISIHYTADIPEKLISHMNNIVRKCNLWFIYCYRINLIN